MQVFCDFTIKIFTLRRLISSNLRKQKKLMKTRQTVRQTLMEELWSTRGSNFSMISKVIGSALFTGLWTDSTRFTPDLFMHYLKDLFVLIYLFTFQIHLYSGVVTWRNVSLFSVIVTDGRKVDIEPTVTTILVFSDQVFQDERHAATKRILVFWVTIFHKLFPTILITFLSCFAYTVVDLLQGNFQSIFTVNTDIHLSDFLTTFWLFDFRYRSYLSDVRWTPVQRSCRITAEHSAAADAIFSAPVHRVHSAWT